MCTIISPDIQLVSRECDHKHTQGKFHTPLQLAVAEVLHCFNWSPWGLEGIAVTANSTCAYPYHLRYIRFHFLHVLEIAVCSPNDTSCCLANDLYFQYHSPLPPLTLNGAKHTTHCEKTMKWGVRKEKSYMWGISATSPPVINNQTNAALSLKHVKGQRAWGEPQNHLGRVLEEATWGVPNNTR